MRDRFEQRTNNAIESIKQAMSEASREFWNCDPKKHIKGKVDNCNFNVCTRCVGNIFPVFVTNVTHHNYEILFY